MSVRRAGVMASAPWIVVLLGAGFMVVLLVLAVATIAGTRRTATDGPDALPPTLYLPTAPETPTPSVFGEPSSSSPSVVTAPSPSRPSPVSPSRPPRSPSATPSRTPAVASALTASYRVLDSDWYSFTGEVTIVNPTAAARTWEVRLAFGDGAGRLIGYSVDSGPKPSENYDVFTGAEPLAPGATVRLRVEYRNKGADGKPTACTVNGQRCTIG